MPHARDDGTRVDRCAVHLVVLLKLVLLSNVVCNKERDRERKITVSSRVARESSKSARVCSVFLLLFMVLYKAVGLLQEVNLEVVKDLHQMRTSTVSRACTVYSSTKAASSWIRERIAMRFTSCHLTVSERVSSGCLFIPSQILSNPVGCSPCSRELPCSPCDFHVESVKTA